MNTVKIPKEQHTHDKDKIEKRRARLGEALRANLKKRREQAKGRCKN